MRVAYVSGFADFVGGGEYSLFDLMTHLPADVKPVLLVPSAGTLSTAAERAGIEWHTAPMSPIGMASLPALWRWRQLIRDIRPDILHANNSRAAFYAGLSGKMMRTPVLFHCRVTELDKRLDRWLVGLVAGIVVNSQATARRFSAWPDIRLWTVYNGVDMTAWDSQAKDEKPFGAEQIILVVSRISHCKRHDIALDVFERLSGRFPGLHLALVGGRDEPEWWRELQARTCMLPEPERVHWLGDVERDELPGWYVSADILLLPSDYESFGRVLVEAMAMGTAVVAFDVGGISEVVEHERQGLLVTPGDVEGMTEAAARLLDDDALRRRMEEAGKIRAAQFSIERHVERICAIYQEVLS